MPPSAFHSATLSAGILLPASIDIRLHRLEDHGPFNQHDSEDFIYVLEGAVVLHLSGEEPIELRQGDSMQMDGRIPHAIAALPSGDDDDHGRRSFARLHWVSVPFD